ncbi:hypothetical protein IJ096_03655 [Candidatus Saccharibacteria bacterium]|nr:hypothetical protein [Candidatus Saccharibacteria bacterium]
MDNNENNIIEDPHGIELTKKEEKDLLQKVRQIILRREKEEEEKRRREMERVYGVGMHV